MKLKTAAIYSALLLTLAVFGMGCEPYRHHDVGVDVDIHANDHGDHHDDHHGGDDHHDDDYH